MSKLDRFFSGYFLRLISSRANRNGSIWIKIRIALKAPVGAMNVSFVGGSFFFHLCRSLIHSSCATVLVGLCLCGWTRAQCPPGWTRVPPIPSSKPPPPNKEFHCVKLFNKQPENWFKAKAICVSHGSKLLEINSPHESRQIAALTSSNRGRLTEAWAQKPT